MYLLKPNSHTKSSNICNITIQIQSFLTFFLCNEGAEYVDRFVLSGSVNPLCYVLLGCKKEENILQILKMMKIISQANPQYKEIICISNGVTAILTNNFITDTPSYPVLYHIYQLLKDLCIVCVFQSYTCFV